MSNIFEELSLRYIDIYSDIFACLSEAIDTVIFSIYLKIIDLLISKLSQCVGQKFN